VHKTNNFDGLRLFGAMLVLVSHQFALSGRHEPHVVGPVSYGALGVLIFFSISGFLVAQSWNSDPDPKRFAMRRMLRIWPALFATVILTTLAALIVTGTVARPLYLLNILLVSVDGPFFPGNPYHLMNGSLWTIPLEVLCYVFLALAGRLRSGSTALLALGCFVGPAYLLIMGPAIDRDTIPAGLRLLPYFAAFFFAGAAQAFHRPGPRVVLAGCFLGGLAFAVGRDTLGLLMVVPLLAIFVGTRSWPILNRAGRFGDLSYGVYLWAWPFQQVGVAVLRHDAPFLVGLAVTIACVLPAAWLSWHFVEKPMLRLKPRRAAATADAAAPLGAVRH
jgi:peptidoglycan/LPS O-acetylase OafA/YrhL